MSQQRWDVDGNSARWRGQDSCIAIWVVPLAFVLSILFLCVWQVVMWHLHKAATVQSPGGHTVFDMTVYQPICRLGGDTYGRVTSMFDLKRPIIKT